jgi:hypothetical protein
LATVIPASLFHSRQGAAMRAFVPHMFQSLWDQKVNKAIRNSENQLLPVLLNG